VPTTPEAAIHVMTLPVTPKMEGLQLFCVKDQQLLFLSLPIFMQYLKRQLAWIAVQYVFTSFLYNKAW
jgi:hypothetical protein